MNVVYPQSDIVIAKTCGCSSGKQRVTYAFSADFHSLCMDKKDLLSAEIAACEKLSKYATAESESEVIAKEIAELKMALDLMT
ncbi:hypothetical protein Ngar_c20290 [Candidatus Nitrososphaera gargensis Ga9.2]|uniref:Uncharacterized protein n=1 Tax=Nitrososphaera gargensis (strain Ga9.2) TaxID=1237085 RepID=K0IC75_NITGG|nr:hypothetical protein [Candidatus Nitrososphaera gargensis]AFU58961.1 hypothetical protein Ngar_c20290 [Candidatus Nitrososphaera gargensis Ga9.2]